MSWLLTHASGLCMGIGLAFTWRYMKVAMNPDPATRDITAIRHNSDRAVLAFGLSLLLVLPLILF